MLPSQMLRDDLERVVKRLKMRGFDFDQALYLSLEQKRKTLQVSLRASHTGRCWAYTTPRGDTCNVFWGPKDCFGTSKVGSILGPRKIGP